MTDIPTATFFFSGVAAISKGTEIAIVEGIQEGNNYEATLILDPQKNITYESDTRNMVRISKPKKLFIEDTKETNCTVKSVKIIGGKTTFIEVELYTAKDLFR